MCLDLFQGMAGKWGSLKLHEPFFWNFCWEFQIQKNKVTIEKKFFINKSVKPLIALKERHQGLLKLHVPLRECSSVDVKMGLQKGNFV